METAVALKLHDELLTAQPEGARHDSDICPLCADKARTTASDPSRFGGPDVSKSETKSTEGGDTPTMSDISQEAHQALLKEAVSSAVAEATKTTEAALATKTKEADDSAAKVKGLEDELATAQTDNDRLNKELDDAQVKLKTAIDKVEGLEKTAKEAADAAALKEVGDKRAEQVKNLKLFPEEYVAERAAKWGAFTDEAWGEQLEEWKQLKPASTPKDGKETDAASAMTGTSDLTKEQQDAAAAGGSDKPSPRRAVLGLH